MSREVMKQPEALRLADALDHEFAQGRISNYNGRKAAVELRRLHEVIQDFLKALHEALETEQEPVAWASSLDFDDDDQEIIPAKDKGKLGTSNCDIPLYTRPKQWVGLTDEEKIELWNKHENHWRFEDNLMAFTRAIEQALKEKNQ